VKNLGAHWNIRHYWVQLVSISCSLARNAPLRSFVSLLWVLCGPLWVLCGPLWSFVVLCGPLRYLVIPLPICFIKASLLTADPPMPVTNASLKLRKRRKRSTCLHQIPHQTRMALLLTISPFSPWSYNYSYNYGSMLLPIVYPEVDCV